MKFFAKNRRALHDYIILDQLETGIVLSGAEAKSVRAGTVNLSAAYALIIDGKLQLVNAHISQYSNAYKRLPQQEDRNRILLVHKRELNRLLGEVSKKGITLIPLGLYAQEGGYIKVKLALCKHKKSYVRKEEIRERDIARETRRELRGKFTY